MACSLALDTGVLCMVSTKVSCNQCFPECKISWHLTFLKMTHYNDSKHFYPHIGKQSKSPTSCLQVLYCVKLSSYTRA